MWGALSYQGWQGDFNYIKLPPKIEFSYFTLYPFKNWGSGAGISVIQNEAMISLIPSFSYLQSQNPQI